MITIQYLIEVIFPINLDTNEINFITQLIECDFYLIFAEL